MEKNTQVSTGMPPIPIHSPLRCICARRADLPKVEIATLAQGTADLRLFHRKLLPERASEQRLEPYE